MTWSWDPPNRIWHTLAPLLLFLLCHICMYLAMSYISPWLDFLHFKQKMELEFHVSHMRMTSLCRNTHNELPEVVKPYTRDKKERIEKPLTLSSNRWDSHFGLHHDFNSTKIICLLYGIHNWTIIALLIIKFSKNLKDEGYVFFEKKNIKDEVEILLFYKHTSQNDLKNYHLWHMWLNRQFFLGRQDSQWILSYDS